MKKSELRIELNQKYMSQMKRNEFERITFE